MCLFACWKAGVLLLPCTSCAQTSALAVLTPSWVLWHWGSFSVAPGLHLAAWDGVGTRIHLLGDAVMCPEKNQEDQGTGLVSPRLVGRAWTVAQGGCVQATWGIVFLPCSEEGSRSLHA